MSVPLYGVNDPLRVECFHYFVKTSRQLPYFGELPFFCWGRTTCDFIRPCVALEPSTFVALPDHKRDRHWMALSVMNRSSLDYQALDIDDLDSFCKRNPAVARKFYEFGSDPNEVDEDEELDPDKDAEEEEEEEDDPFAFIASSSALPALNEFGTDVIYVCRSESMETAMKAAWYLATRSNGRCCHNISGPFKPPKDWATVQQNSCGLLMEGEMKQDGIVLSNGTTLDAVATQKEFFMFFPRAKKSIKDANADEEDD